MKNLYLLIFVILGFCFLTSCSSTKKVTINGTPGAVIKTPKNEYLGKIADNGKVTIKLKRWYHYAFLLSKAPYSDEYVPFALDYKNVNKSFVKDFSEATALTLTFGGVAIVGICALKGGDNNMMLPALSAGLAGLLVYAPSLFQEGFLDVEYNYNYLKNQSTNNDLFNKKNRSLLSH